MKNIDLNAIFEPARKGVARGYIFAGFAINAASDPRLTEFHPGRAARRIATSSLLKFVRRR